MLLGLNRKEIKTQTQRLTNSMNVGLACLFFVVVFLYVYVLSLAIRVYMSISLTNLREETSIAFLFDVCLHLQKLLALNC